MLVLSRTVSESITIGPDIRLTVTKVRNGTVRIGIEAPRELVILRHDAVVLTPKSERASNQSGDRNL